jgi:nucleoside-diphosphate-sugar epimerase
MSRKQVVFGTGPVGLTIVDQLIAQNKQVLVVSRSGRATVPEGVEIRAADATEHDVVRELCQGAEAVYHCANVPYTEQYEVIPKLQSALIAGAGAAGAKLIVTDTLYSYGETHGTPMTEETPFAATTRKGKLRAETVRRYLVAYQAGTVRVALGRAADFFGPRVYNSSFGQMVFPSAMAGKPIQVLGNIDLPHSYSYIDDVARGLITLADHDDALGKSWLLPVAPTVTTRDMIGLVEKELGRTLEVQALPVSVIEQIGEQDAQMRELVEMFYQYTEPQIVDSRHFETTFGWHATPLDEAIRATVTFFSSQGEPA